MTSVTQVAIIPRALIPSPLPARWNCHARRKPFLGAEGQVDGGQSAIRLRLPSFSNNSHLVPFGFDLDMNRRNRGGHGVNLGAVRHG